MLSIMFASILLLLKKGSGRLFLGELCDKQWRRFTCVNQPISTRVFPLSTVALVEERVAVRGAGTFRISMLVDTAAEPAGGYPGL